VTFARKQLSRPQRRESGSEALYLLPLFSTEKEDFVDFAAATTNPLKP
jgi:hypothetical protein